MISDPVCISGGERKSYFVELILHQSLSRPYYIAAYPINYNVLQGGLFCQPHNFAYRRRGAILESNMQPAEQNVSKAKEHLHNIVQLLLLIFIQQVLDIRPSSGL